MNKKRVTYLALGAFVFAASCSKEAAEPDVIDWGDGKINIRPTIDGILGSRAQDMTLDRLKSFQVTCFNYVSGASGTEGYLSPHFENATFVLNPNQASASFISSPDEEPHDWPANGGIIRFYAFFPSMSDMGGAARLKGTQHSYSLDSIRINSDISNQFDFITAETEGDRWKDFAGGVDLGFCHQLSQIELKAWGDASNYIFDIAGLRIGNPVVEDKFVFAGNDSDGSGFISQAWEGNGDGKKGKVEYLYRNAESDGLMPGDRIFSINQSEHNTAESAGSIMGNGGCAMVIPTVNARWEELNDPEITDEHYKTERMYFSVLMRVMEPETGTVVYPYPGNPYGNKTISFAVDDSGVIVQRLYKSKTEELYFYDEQLTNPYSAPQGVEPKDFGWAAVPVDADWSAGKKYIYTLNYSEGIGRHDPEDPEPGKLIVGQTPVEWSVSVSDWTPARKDENFDPDLNAP